VFDSRQLHLFFAPLCCVAAFGLHLSLGISDFLCDFWVRDLAGSLVGFPEVQTEMESTKLQFGLSSLFEHLTLFANRRMIDGFTGTGKYCTGNHP